MNVKQTLAIATAFFSISSIAASDRLTLSHLPDKEKPFKLIEMGYEGEGMKGKTVITAGAGLNYLGTAMEFRYLTNTYYDFDNHIVGHDVTPMYHIGMDYGFHQRFSVGLALGYQKVVMHIRDVVTLEDMHHDTWKRVHLAGRLDYYIVARENANLYTGIKLGYNRYDVSTTVPIENYTVFLTKPSAYSAQAHFGFSYFIKGRVGFNTEIGLGYGVPYLILAGVTVKM